MFSTAGGAPWSATTILVLTGLNLLAMSFGFLAAITARWYWKDLRRRLALRSTRSLQQLDAELAALSSTVSSLSVTTRRISSRIGMQDVRARRSAALDPTAPMTKAQIRAALASGQLRVLSDSERDRPSRFAAEGARRTNGSAVHSADDN